jgi:dimethylhistidine N-methyltransferase
VGSPASEASRFAADVLAGLSSPQRTLPCKYLYDATGSALFDKITTTPEYYPTRTEIGILRDRLAEIAELVGFGADVVELGGCNPQKARLLLAGLDEPRYYVPIDVAAAGLTAAARRMVAEFPGLRVWPLAADFAALDALPTPIASGGHTLYFFPGSTVGNFAPADAVALLANLRVLARHASLLIGVDLVKDKATLERAYNDASGYTAAFNLNILAHVNRRLSGNFDPDAWEHLAFYDEARQRIEMHLRSRRTQTVTIAGRQLTILKDETIHTECSYKHTVPGFQALAARAGFQAVRAWTDPDERFSVHYLRTAR